MSIVQKAAKVVLIARLIGFIFKALSGDASRAWAASRRLKRLQAANAAAEAAAATASATTKADPELQLPATPRPKNIVIIGASFAGYSAARAIARSLPANTPYRVVVVEPHSHFHHTWVLPRLCVVEGHEHKALITYGGYLKGAPAGIVRWIRDSVASVSRTSVVLQASGEEVPYEFLVVATGSGANDGLPSRVGSADKEEGIELLRNMQRRIKEAKKVVIVGGGAAGVELATDAKDKYPDKEVVLIHSRSAVMHRFGPELQEAALQGLKALGVEVFLNERASVDADGRLVTLTSGRSLECDLFISCVGQRPCSDLISSLAPDAITATGHIRVRPSMQVADDSLSNVYVCGDVADAGARNTNARAAASQATIAADNILLAIEGREPVLAYTPHWPEAGIKLTLGLYDSVIHFGDGKTELLWKSRGKDVTLNVDGAWKGLGATPFEDTDELAPYRQMA